MDIIMPIIVTEEKKDGKERKIDYKPISAKGS